MHYKRLFSFVFTGLCLAAQLAQSQDIKDTHSTFSAFTQASHSGIIYEVQRIESFGLCMTVTFNEIHVPGASLPVVTDYDEHISIPDPDSAFEYIDAVNQFGEPVEAAFLWKDKTFNVTPCPIVYITAPPSILLYEAPGAQPMVNTSNRALVTPEDPAIAGFILKEASWIIVRGIAPSMQGVEETISDPIITLLSDQYLIDDFNDDLENSITNDDWETTLRKETLEFWWLTPESPQESALVTYLFPGAYTVHLNSKGETGQALVEVFVAPYSLPIY